MEINHRFSIKKQNRIAILRLIHQFGARSRVDIAQTMKLTKAAVTIITNEMIEQGLLVEKGAQPQEARLTRGRRKILLDINENYRLVFGIVIEKEQLIVGLCNLQGQALDKKRIDIHEKAYREVLELIVGEMNLLMKNNCLSWEKILALGICIGNGCDSFMDNRSLEEKLLRIKKDLSHAISVKIVTQTTMNGALIAQKILQENCPSIKNILMLRYGNPIDVGVMIHSEIYHSKRKMAGGFIALQQRGTMNTYQRYLNALADGQDFEKATLALNQQLAQCIHFCHLILDTDEITCFGDYFEQDGRLNEINALLASVYRENVMLTPSLVNQQNIYLAPCAVAIEQCFYFEGV